MGRYTCGIRLGIVNEHHSVETVDLHGRNVSIDVFLSISIKCANSSLTASAITD